MSELFAVGLNHKATPVELREQLAVGDGEHAPILEALRERLDLSELMLVSTCNRVELYGVAHHRDHARAALTSLAQLRDIDPRPLDGHVFTRAASDAARHIFRVASSLESIVVGEPQILGQVKTAFGRARESGTVGPVLDRCLTLAFKCAKRVRTETEIARGSASVPSVAVDLAKTIFGELEQSQVLVIGAGEMAEQAATHLTAAGAAAVAVVNRSEERGARLAEQVGGRFRPWEHLDEELGRADIVIASTGSKLPIIDRRRLKPVMKKRRHRPLFFVDIAVPRDVDTSVSKLEGVFLYNVDDLQGIVHDNLRSRHVEAARANELVDQEVQAFNDWMRSRAIGPLLGQLQAHGRSIVELETERALAKLGELPAQQRAVVEQLGHAIMRKLLHRPMTNVKKAGGAVGGRFDGPALAEAMQALFELAPPAAALAPADDSAAAEDAPAPVPDPAKAG
jgi:glutamyl-tRNA reductase